MKTFKDYGIEILSSATGPEVATQCPQCSSQRKKKTAKCLSVNIEKKTWHCWHCAWVGGLGQHDTTDLPQRQRIYRRPEPQADTGLSKSGLDWFADRKITKDVLLRNHVEIGTAYFPQIEDKAEAAIFPYFQDGTLINRKYRMLSNKDFRLESGCELILYGLEDINPTMPLIWCEGECDKLAIEVAGFLNAVSVPNGAPSVNAKNYESQFAFLDSAHERIEAVKNHIIAVDSDGPGSRLEDELSRRLGVERCYRVRWPEGCKDANDVLIKHGPEELRWYLNNSQPFPIEGVFQVADRHDDIMRLYKHGYEQGHSTGWSNLDNYYTVRPGEFTAVTGIPSSGKSNVLDALCINLAELHDWRFAMFSPENLPLEQHMSTLIEKRARRPFHSNHPARLGDNELKLAMDWVGERFFWIMPSSEDDWTLEKILNAASQLCLRYGIRGLVIDPWNELESQRPTTLSETEYISQSLKRIRVFARQRKIHVWVVIHPAKLYRDKVGKYPVPSLYDCSGSAHWRNKADNGITVWRDLSLDDTNEVQIHIQKIRFRQVGKRGMVQLFYEPLCATYSDKPKFVRDVET